MESRQTVVLSGALGGIGRAIATRLANDGYRLALLYHMTPQSEVDTFARTLAGEGHLALSCDITSRSATETSIKTVRAQMDHVDVCVHAAAGKIIRKRPSAMNAQEFRQEFEVTTFGAFNLFDAVLPDMKARTAGHLIALTTAGIERAAQPGAMAGYLAAKAALRQLLRDLAQEVGPLGIRVNAIAPAFVDTPLHADLPSPVRSFLSERTGMTSEAVADIAAVLCTASSATGMTFFAKDKTEPL